MNLWAAGGNASFTLSRVMTQYERLASSKTAGYGIRQSAQLVCCSWH